MKERIWLGLGIAFVILTFSSILFPALTSTVEAGWFQSGNPVPAISTLSPSGVQAGGPNFTLTVNGTSFISNSVVRWNGADRATTFVSATRLTILVPSSDIAATGTVSITVFNPAPNGGESNSVAFQINNKTNTTTITSNVPNPSAQSASVTVTNSVVYLPLISKAPPPRSMYLPLIAIAPIATPTPVPNPVVNDGFEQPNSQNGPWYAIVTYPGKPAQGIDVRTDASTLNSVGVSPHSGNYAAWLGGLSVNGYQMDLQQQIAVPAGGSTLRYWIWIQSGESTCDINNVDGAWVFFITDQQHQVDAYSLCAAYNTNGWVKRDLDLSNYVGQTGWLTFSARILGANSNWFIDDVQMGTLSGASFTPYTRR